MEGRKVVTKLLLPTLYDPGSITAISNLYIYS